MPRTVRCSLIQSHTDVSPDLPLPQLKQALIDKHLTYIRQAADAGAQIVCLQELFNGPYFCAEQQVRWYDFTEPVPDGPTIQLMQDTARSPPPRPDRPGLRARAGRRLLQHRRVISAEGDYLGKYRKTHIPHVAPGFWEKVLFPPRQPRLSRLRPGRGAHRRLHLLRPPLSRRRARPRLERRRNRLQSLRHRRWIERAPLETGAARARRGQRLLRRRHQPRRRRSPLGTSANSTGPATSAIRAARSSPRHPATAMKSSLPISTLT